MEPCTKYGKLSRLGVVNDGACLGWFYCVLIEGWFCKLLRMGGLGSGYGGVENLLIFRMGDDCGLFEI